MDLENVCNLKDVLSSRMKKRRDILKMKKSLPVTPIKRVAIISSYLSERKSLTVNLLEKMKTITSPEDLKNVEMADAIISDLKEVVDQTKLKRSADARATTNVDSAAVNGVSVRKLKCIVRLSQKLGFSTKRLSTGNLDFKHTL